MANVNILYAKPVAESFYSKAKRRISNLVDRGIVPGLAVTLVGENPASLSYVKSKARVFKELNLKTKIYRFHKDVDEAELLNKINEVNNDSFFHGILVQLPLPKKINSDKLIRSIDPNKDVDGFHPFNAGLLSIGRPSFIPCTPKGIMELIKYYKIDMIGKNVVVLGRSNIVGRPISILTSLNDKFANATTTLCHSKSKDIYNFTLNADIIIIALGIPLFLKSNMVNENCVIIDVGINRIEHKNKKDYKIVGDADFSSLVNKVSAISPAPGGVGPMTIAMLVDNTIVSAEKTL